MNHYIFERGPTVDVARVNEDACSTQGSRNEDKNNNIPISSPPEKAVNLEPSNRITVNEEWID